MSRLRIVHNTGFRYEGKATASYNEARMLPLTNSNQFVLTSRVKVEPVTTTHRCVDYWGTTVTYFDVLSSHEELSISAESLVEVMPHPVDYEGVDWTELRYLARGNIELIEQLTQGARTAPSKDLSDVAREIAGDSASPREAARLIAEFVGAAVEYVPGSTGVHSTAAEVWQGRKGVCQDISHLVLGALRSVDIPARYVSGYLHPKPDAPLGERVVGESHAWVEWNCGDGWEGYDPTNLTEIGTRHVIVGRGRDYADVAPLRGVYAGPESSELFVTVELTKEG